MQVTLEAPALSEQDRYAAWWIARYYEFYTGEVEPVIPAPRRSMLISRTGHVIKDIGLRMFHPSDELKLMQGFPPEYVLDRGHDGRVLSKAVQNRLIGNSVPPDVAEAIVRWNVVARPPVPANEDTDWTISAAAGV